jgi:hypothetical protein
MVTTTSNSSNIRITSEFWTCDYIIVTLHENMLGSFIGFYEGHN